jgi:hypothetical protein
MYPERSENVGRLCIGQGEHGEFFYFSHSLARLSLNESIFSCSDIVYIQYTLICSGQVHLAGVNL